MEMLGIFLIVITAVSWLLTGLFRHYALAHNLVDIPNRRSSHTVATPRGGGIAIALSFFVGLLYLTMMSDIDRSVAWALFGSGIGIVSLGLLDDRGHINVRWRLLAHCICAVWALYWIRGFPSVVVLGATWNFGWVGDLIAVLYIVWTINLYNFMDGIDGIASVEAICVAGSAAIISVLLDKATLASIPLLLTATVTGFLFWNFPRAKIFMGDAGSGFLGVVLAILSLESAWLEPKLLWCWVILLASFVTDATYTLLMRIIRGERVYEAHRSHAYQSAARRYSSHSIVTLAVGLINLAWLFPIALLVGLGKVNGILGVLIAYVPLLALVIKYRAGMESERLSA